MDIPKTHKALVYDKPGEISTNVVDVETPTPGPGEVLVKMYDFHYSFSGSNTHVQI
jgi:propanol-preferring alcohol dehydrogenase